MKTSELTGAALDWAVAKCEGKFNEDGDYWADPEGIWYFLTARNNPSEGLPWTNGSTDWAQGGPIIEREGIAVVAESPEMWCAWRSLEGYMSEENSVYGDTPLIAAMRCYVAAMLGDEVDVPDDLLEVA